MSAVKQRIQEDVKSAMRSQDKDRVSILRLIMAAIKQKEVDENIQLDDVQVLAVLDKMIKQHRESITQYQHGGRADLVDKETRELSVVQSYLPAPLSDSQIEELLLKAIQDSGATSMKDMGKVMSILKPLIQGKADMVRVSALVKGKLSG